MRRDPRQRPLHVVYRIDHHPTGQYYIGLHSCEDPHDDYMGSGVELRRLYAKYGRQSCAKTILAIYKHRTQAMAEEARLVTHKTLADPLCLNRCLGGIENHTKRSRK